MGSVDRTKHDEDIAEHVIGGVRAEQRWTPDSAREHPRDDADEAARRPPSRRRRPRGA